ncbi:MAG: putative O-glycosylation ligase, exosortase A system-associated [Pseudomonadota bacterium]
MIRALIILGILFWFGAKVFSRPYIGTYLWTWVSLMNPHKLTWGILNTLPLAQVIALITAIGFFTGRQKKLNIWSPQTNVLLIFILWVIFTSFFAINPSGAYFELDRFIKIQIFIFLIIALVSDKEKLDGFIWVIVLSLGFYGVKGGIFTILTGGGNRVFGPSGSFIGENNALALALLMTIPLMRYLQLQTNKKLVKHGLTFAMLMTAASILGSQSRGALLGIIAIGVFFWWKSTYKLSATLMVGVVASLIFMFMPQSWWDRMNTIETYNQDESANARINSWIVAFNMANDRITGGAPGMWIPKVFSQHAPNPNVVFDAHSIYFEILGEQGWIGLFLFLLLAFLTWRSCTKMIKTYKSVPEKKWAADLAAMVQVSLIGYYVSGAFLGLAYFDYYYDLIAITIIASKLAAEQVPLSTNSPPHSPSTQKKKYGQLISHKQSNVRSNN